MKLLEKISANKRLKYTSYSSAMMIGLIAIVLLINYFVTTLDKNYDLSVDMTAYRIYSLTSITGDVLDNLGEDIYIYTTETAGIEDANVAELLSNYASASKKIHISNIDIVKRPASIEYYNEFSDFSVSAGSVIVSNSPSTNDTKQRYRILDTGDLYTYNQEMQSYDRFNAEDAITGAIKYITNPNNQLVWILDNHNSDKTSNLAIKEMLEDENYQVKMLNILNGQNPLEAGDIVMAVSMENDLTPTERDILSSFLDDGGRMVIGIDPTIYATTNLSNIVSLVQRYNIKLGQGIIMETNLDNIAVTSDNEYMYSFIIPKLNEHEITDDFIIGDYKLLLGMSVGRLLLPEKINDSDITIEAVLSTADTSFIEPWSDDMDGEADEGAEYGEFVVMAAITDARETPSGIDAKMIVLSAPELFTYAESFSQNIYRNKDFLVKSISWLSTVENDFYISSKPLASSPLMIETMNQAYFIIAFVCVIIPLLIFATGVIIYLRRKNL